jgi:hypothetical protein
MTDQSRVKRQSMVKCKEAMFLLFLVFSLIYVLSTIVADNCCIQNFRPQTTSIDYMQNVQFCSKFNVTWSCDKMTVLSKSKRFGL